MSPQHCAPHVREVSCWVLWWSGIEVPNRRVRGGTQTNAARARPAFACTGGRALPPYTLRL